MGETFELNELVICKNNAKDLFGYVANIKTVEPVGKAFSYAIHFKGWNSRYDILVKAEDVDKMLMKHTPELEAHHKKLLDESKGKTAKKKATDTPVVSAKKRKTEREGSADSSQSSGARRMSTSRNEDLAVNIPDKLRALLMDDNDLINRQSKLVKLPAQYTVDDIVKEYSTAVAANNAIAEVAGNDEALVEYDSKKAGKSKGEVVLNKHDMVQSSLGILDYFNILMGSQLLYARERAQYSAACVNPPAGAPGQKVNGQETPELEDLKITPSSVYGLPHLVRLFVKIGPLLHKGSYGDKSLQIILKHITDFLIFLSKNSELYNKIDRDYEVAINKDA